MYLSKKHLQALQPPNRKVAAEIQAKDLRQKYREYVHEFGLAQSCSIQREQGDEISLMTEIVTYRNNKNLYPSQAQRSKMTTQYPARRASQKNKPSQLKIDQD